MSSRNGKVQLFLIDPHTFVRQAVRLLLTSTGEVDVVGDSATFAEALTALGHRADEPCVLLVEPGTTAIEEMFALVRALPGFPVVVLSGFWEEQTALEILERGAAGYLLKTVDCEEMVRALREVQSGHVYIDPRVSRDLIQRVSRQGPVGQQASVEYLTSRELNVLALASQGLNNRSIADSLGLSESTIKTHLRSVYAKLGVSDRTQAVLKGLRSGLITMGAKAATP